MINNRHKYCSRHSFLLSLLVVVSFMFSCNEAQKTEYVDLPQIIEKGELVALTISSPTSYFNYRGKEMGFHYDVADMFAKSLGLSLVIKQAHDEDELIRMLMGGKGDLIAYDLHMTNMMKDSITYCGMENVNHQVLVQRRGKQSMRNVTQLVGKEVYVLPGRSSQRMENLNDELGGGVRVKEISHDSVSVEDLITWVSQGKIDYTVANNQVARFNRNFYHNLDISMVISFDQRSSWAVRKTSPLLAEAVSKWHKENMDSPEVKTSIKRYFESSKKVSRGTILSLEEGKISLYDDLFRKYSKEIGWDWRMLAALAFTESNFNPDIVSWAGARGLMQLMPVTSHAMGMPEGMESDPEESIKAAVKYIATLQRLFRKIENPEEKINFVLASYNAGAGHVIDAMELAEKYGRNRYIWKHNVEHYILLKSNEEYYLDPVCKNGYFRGAETYNFVKTVQERTRIYQSKIKK